MTSKERVIKALSHEATDRIPIDLGGTLVSGIHAYAYNELKKFLKINTGKIEIIDTMQFIARVEEQVMNKLGVDVLPVLNPYDALGIRYYVGSKTWTMPNGIGGVVSSDFNPVKQLDGSYQFEWGGCTFKMAEDGLYFDVVRPILHNVHSFKEIENKIDFRGFSNEEILFQKTNLQLKINKF